MRLTHLLSRCVLAVALAAVLAPAASSFASIVLVRAGQARSVIVVPPEADRYEKEAADELALHLRRMSGADVPIVTDGAGRDGMARILVGRAATAVVADLGVGRALGERVDEMSSRDGFVTRAGGDVVALAGARPPGTAYAAFDLLERLGCRWFFPGDLGTVVPRRRTVTIEPFETVQRPSFDLRSMWVCGFGGENLNRDDRDAIEKWRHRNRQSYDYEWNAGHNMQDTTAESLAQPEQVDVVARRILADFEREPQRQWYSLGWNDNYCHVSAVQAMGIVHPWYPLPQATDPLVRFYNAVVEKVEPTHPGKKYGFLAYMDYLPAPVTVRPHPSLVPVVAPIEQCPRHVPLGGECWQRDALLEAIRAWCRVSDRVLIYDYEPGFLIDGGVPVPCVTRMRHEYPLWHEAGVRGLYAQVQMTVMNNGPTKGCHPETFATLQATRSIQANYQLHKNQRPDGNVNNTDDEYIANTEKDTSGNYVRLSVNPDGSTFTVHIPANGHSRTFRSKSRSR